MGYEIFLKAAKQDIEFEKMLKKSYLFLMTGLGECM